MKRRKALTIAQVKNIKRQLKSGKKSLRDVSYDLKVKGVNVSYNTVRPTAVGGRQPLKYKAVCRKPLMTKKHEAARLEFAYANMNRK